MEVVVNEFKDAPGCVFIFIGVNISIIWPVNVDTDLKLISFKPYQKDQYTMEYWIFLFRDVYQQVCVNSPNKHGDYLQFAAHLNT